MTEHLESEIAALKAQMRVLEDEMLVMVDERNAAVLDAKRLDWLDTVECGISHRGYGDFRYYIGDGFTKKIREVVDEAMKEMK